MTNRIWVISAQATQRVGQNWPAQMRCQGSHHLLLGTPRPSHDHTATTIETRRQLAEHIGAKRSGLRTVQRGGFVARHHARSSCIKQGLAKRQVEMHGPSSLCLRCTQRASRGASPSVGVVIVWHSGINEQSHCVAIQVALINCLCSTNTLQFRRSIRSQRQEWHFVV